MSVVKFAVVGQGHIGKRHAEMIRRERDAELIAICDNSKWEELGLENSSEPYFSSLEEMLSSGLKFDVVNICTPNGLHAKQSLQVLEAGKHVVIEKPMALTKAECEQIIFRALQVSKKVFVVMQNRYSPPSVWLKEIVDDRTLGDIYIVQINCYWNRDARYYMPGGAKSSWKGSKELDGGTLFTQFSHFIDIMYWIFGDIRDIRARLADFNHSNLTEFEDSGTVNFEFVKGGIGVLNYSTSVWNKNMESSITVIGSKGSLKIGGQYMDHVEYCHIENYNLPELKPTNPPNEYAGYTGSANNHHLAIQNVVNSLKNGDSPATNAMEGLKVVEIIERIYQEAGNGLIKNKL